MTVYYEVAGYLKTYKEVGLRGMHSWPSGVKPLAFYTE